MKSIAVFADVQNIYYTTREVFQRHLDYRALWQKISAQGNIVCAYAYAIDRDDEKQKQFQTALRQIGFSVKLKPFIQRSDGSAKGDWDVGITIDVLEQSAYVDKIVLISGDGDFDVLLTHIMTKYKVETCIYGVAGLTANSLISKATSFYTITPELLL